MTDPFAANHRSSEMPEWRQPATRETYTFHKHCPEATISTSGGDPTKRGTRPGPGRGRGTGGSGEGDGDGQEAALRRGRHAQRRSAKTGLYHCGRQKRGHHERDTCQLFFKGTRVRPAKRRTRYLKLSRLDVCNWLSVVLEYTVIRFICLAGRLGGTVTCD